MLIPSMYQAEEYLAQAQEKNPGPWVDHSRYTAQAARAIGEKHPELEGDTGYVLGLLHNIGRRKARTYMRHGLDGYNFLLEEGYPQTARICLTHSFPYQNVEAVFGDWDCTQEEFDFVKKFLYTAEYTEYDRLIQLCAVLSHPTGFFLLERRMVQSVLKYDVHDFLTLKWQAIFKIKKDMEKAIEMSVYDLLPGVVDNTFYGEL